jgi:hypothetical protein
MYLNFETSNTFFSFILVCTREETVLNLKLFLSFFFSINLNKLLIWQVIVKILVVNPVQKEQRSKSIVKTIEKSGNSFPNLKDGLWKAEM